VKRLFSLFAAALTAFAMAAAPPYADQFEKGRPAIQAMSSLTFGPDGILFVGDSIGARIFALDLEDRAERKLEKELRIPDIEAKVAAMLGVDASDAMIHDMAVNPLSHNVYLAVSRGRQNWTGGWQRPNDAANADTLLRITPDGKIDAVDLDSVSHAAATLPSPVADKVDRRNRNLRVDAISDMAYADGKLYVAGLSNEEFASSMRILSFPFDDKAAVSTLEVYHGAHGKYETHSPVRAFLPYEIDGEPHVLASYLCTPLALFPTKDLAEGKHVKGKTIAELGFGNYPLDMLAYRHDDTDYVLIVNSMRGLMRVKAADLHKPIEPIVTEAKPGEGIPFETVRGSGILAVEPLTAKYILALARQANGRLDLLTLDPRWL